MEIPRQ